MRCRGAQAAAGLPNAQSLIQPSRSAEAGAAGASSVRALVAGVHRRLLNVRQETQRFQGEPTELVVGVELMERS